MRKYVYLFELDSVRKTDSEIVAGQRALYDEIVKNGNIVVLTYNQLIDSRAFFSLLDNKNYYESFIDLFEKGYIRISQYGNIRTIAQYLLSTIDSEDNKFIYSALPIKSSQRRLVELIKRSITYSDLSEINEYIHRINRTDEELIDLFVEVETFNSKEGVKVIEKPSELEVANMINVLENLYWLLGMVLRLSTVHNIFIPPREPSEYASFKLKDFLSYVCSISTPPSNNELWHDTIEILTKLKCWGTNNRSIYFHELEKLSKTGNVDLASLQYAEAIVSVCTNYAYEMSICNISKHYNTRDVKAKPSTESSFFKDFWSRLEQHWDSGSDAENRFLQNESNVFNEYVADDSLINCFEEAARIVPDVVIQEEGDSLPRYEYNLKNQRRKQKLLLLGKVPGQILSLLVAVVLAMFLNIAFEVLHSLYAGEFELLVSFNSFISFGIEAIVFFIIGEFITTKISNKFPKFLSLSEAAQGIVCAIKDAVHLLFSKANTYVSENDIDDNEKRNQSKPIDFLESNELKKYESFYKANPELVAYAAEYPIADVTNKDKLKAVVRNQELFKRKYGVVYSSQFNTMVVDPIEDSKLGFYSYERIIPSSKKNGVVLLTMHQGKLVLIKQFRHAIRGEQLCCPRGFGEQDIDMIDNAKKELLEELNARVIEEPVELGTITSDSGLSSGSATVYLMTIGEYNNLKEEGIREIVEISLDELSDRIAHGEINDGYTLAALALYTSSIS